MNILFIDHSEHDSLNGGLDRVVCILSDFLKKNLGYTIYNACAKYKNISNVDLILKDDEKAVIRLRQFLIDKKIDVIANMRPAFYIQQIVEAKKGLSCKYIVQYHFTPYYMHKDAIPAFKRLIHHDIKIRPLKYGVKLLLYPLWTYVYYKRRMYYYKKNYNASDKYVLLSDNFIDDFRKEVGLKDASKLVSIANPLSYSTYLPLEQLKEKEKEVLIVSRFVNNKRVDMSLKIWRFIEKERQDWTLKLVGFGPEQENLEKLVKKLRLKNVVFVGKAEPFEFYKKASIFMSNSALEGWMLTLTEAQQMGCVPIAMNSYKALPQIIDSGKDGIIIPNNNIKEFVNQLLYLMNNREVRERMAVNGIESCKRFTIDKIAAKWVELFEELKSN